MKKQTLIILTTCLLLAAGSGCYQPPSHGPLSTAPPHNGSVGVGDNGAHNNDTDPSVLVDEKGTLKFTADSGAPTLTVRFYQFGTKTPAPVCDGKDTISGVAPFTCNATGPDGDYTADISDQTRSPQTITLYIRTCDGCSAPTKPGPTNPTPATNPK